ncbi:MAG: glycosyltransferase family 39 protein [Chloroflexi bacterium]|nr:glycosyltransferase family 39 protein [Chloroflexota bacterium]
MRHPPFLALLVGAAFLLRIAFAATQPTAPVYQKRSGDESRYLKLGYDLISGRSYAETGLSNAPLYPLSVGLILRPFLLPQSAAETAALHASEVLPPATLRNADLPIHLIRGWGALLGAALVWIVYRGAQRLSGDERAATVAALAVAIGPAFIREAAVIGTETMYLTLLAGGVVAAMEAQDGRGAAWSGLCFGLATLTRMPPLLLPPLLVLLWWVQSRRRRSVLRVKAFRTSLALLGSFGAVLAIWALYALLAWGRPMLVSDASIGAVALRGALGRVTHWEIDRQTEELTGAVPSEESALPYETAFWEVFRQDPFGYLVRRAEALWGAALQPHGTLYFSGPSLKAMLADWWQEGRSAREFREIMRAPGFGGKALLWAFHLVVLAGGLLGAGLLRLRGRQGAGLTIIALALLYTYGLHFWLDANARYLFPNEPLWWMLAGAGLVWIGEQVAESGGR